MSDGTSQAVDTVSELQSVAEGCYHLGLQLIIFPVSVKLHSEMKAFRNGERKIHLCPCVT